MSPNCDDIEAVETEECSEKVCLKLSLGQPPEMRKSRARTPQLLVACIPATNEMDRSMWIHDWGLFDPLGAALWEFQ
jgi:hypothetical protein